MKTSIKLLSAIIITIAIFIFPQQAHSQEDAFPDRPPLDSVPCWVKEQVSPEEYKLWKTLSSIFRVDYSVLKSEMPSEYKQHIYDGLKKICTDIKQGKLSSQKGTGFQFAKYTPVDTTLAWKVCDLNQINDNLQFCKRKAIIYEIEDTNIQLECSIWYIYDAQNKDVHIITYDFNPIGSWVQSNGDGRFLYQKEKGCLQGSYAGTLQYLNNRKHEKMTFEKSFAFKLE